MRAEPIQSLGEIFIKRKNGESEMIGSFVKNVQFFYSSIFYDNEKKKTQKGIILKNSDRDIGWLLGFFLCNSGREKSLCGHNLSIRFTLFNTWYAL